MFVSDASQIQKETPLTPTTSFAASSPTEDFIPNFGRVLSTSFSAWPSILNISHETWGSTVRFACHRSKIQQQQFHTRHHEDRQAHTLSAVGMRHFSTWRGGWWRCWSEIERLENSRGLVYWQQSVPHNQIRCVKAYHYEDPAVLSGPNCIRSCWMPYRTVQKIWVVGYALRFSPLTCSRHGELIGGGHRDHRANRIESLQFCRQLDGAQSVEDSRTGNRKGFPDITLPDRAQKLGNHSRSDIFRRN